MLSDSIDRKFAALFVYLTCCFAGLRSPPFRMLHLDLFATIKEALDRASPERLLVKNVKNRLDAANHNVQWYSAVLPGLDQGPIERTQKEAFPSTADKRVFDLGEIIIVIQAISLRRNWKCYAIRAGFASMTAKRCT